MKPRRSKKCERSKVLKAGVRITNPATLFKKLNRIKLWPPYILTTEENKKSLIEWFGKAPGFANYYLLGSEILTPKEVFVL